MLKLSRFFCDGLIIALLGICFQGNSLLYSQEIAGNTWVRIADCPGDSAGREIPPARGATWVFCPPLNGFVRYGGFTPRFSNAMDFFDLKNKTWSIIWGEDENYPLERPGGGMAWMIQWDESKQKIFLGGGRATTYAGSRGIYSFDPKTKSFTCLTQELPSGVLGMVYDPKADIFVGAPGAGSEAPNKTWVFSVKSSKWEQKPTSPCPQDIWFGGMPMIYHEDLGRIIAIGNIAKDFTVWAFDSQKLAWEKLSIPNGPSPRTNFALGYDNFRKVILLHGGSKTGTTDPFYDTWVLDVAKSEWKEIKTPGLPPLKGINNRDEIIYKLALAYDPVSKRMVLADADLGVWAFRYDPETLSNITSTPSSFVPTVNLAAKNAPAKIEKDREEFAKEKRLILPTELNPKITSLNDNSIIALNGGQNLHGHEVGWTYDSDAGVLVKYGGCGNRCHPFWTGYSNSLLIFDPGTERVYARRVCDIAGAARPATGCTRSVAYDNVQKVTWLFGGVGSGPYCPGSTAGSVSYNILTDQFELAKQPWPEGLGNPGCLVQFASESGLAFYYQMNKAWLFNNKTASWSMKPNTGGPEGGGYVYQRIAYIKSKKIFLVLSVKGQPADPKKNQLDTQENNTYSYDPATNTWTDLKPANQPPFRASKFGLAYDSKNDVVLLVGGGTGWNAGPRNDMWVYIVKENRWEEVKPQLAGDLKAVPVFPDGMHCDYDHRHNAFILAHQGIFAYRYKK